MYIITMVVLIATAILYSLGRREDYRSSLGQPEAHSLVRDENKMFSPGKYVFWSIFYPVLAVIFGLVLLNFLQTALWISLIPVISYMTFGGILGFKDAARNDRITGRKS